MKALRKGSRRRKLKVWVKCCLWLGVFAGMFVLGRIGLYAYFPKVYTDPVEQWSREYGVEENFIYAVIHTESNFRKDVVSVNDACGLMQILPATFEWLQTKDAADETYVREDLFTPEVNIRYGVLYLSILQEQFGTLQATAAGYHAGMGAVERWLQEEEYSSDGKILERIPYRDTARYVRKIEKTYQIYNWLY